MSNAFSICFNKAGNTQLPCELNDASAVSEFRENNPHILANFIPHGFPFMIYDQAGALTTSTWQQRFPGKALLFSQLQAMPLKERINIADMVNQYGSDLLTAIATFNEDHIKPIVFHEKIDPRKGANQVGYSGAFAGGVQTRFDKFGDIATHYQKNLEAIRQATLAKKPRLVIMKLEKMAKNTHAELNNKFKAEIAKYGNRGGTKGTAWTNVQRGINQAKSARSFQPITLSNTREFNLIKRLASNAKFAGAGALIVDAGLRTKGVYNSYQSGGNWQKKAAVQTAGFGFGAAGAMVLGGAAAKFVLGLALASTPLGWVIVIGVGLSAGYAAGVAGDAFGQGVANKAYDVGSFLNTL